MCNTNSDDKLIGFEYQFFYFLLSLLRMKIGDTVGFEVEEDVHIQKGNQLLLCQLKHSIQKNTNNEIKNLTTADSDLWKTLSLWVDKIAKISNIDDLKSIYFVFVSNKSDNEGNDFLTNFRTFKTSQNILNFKDYLNRYKDKLEKKHGIKKIEKSKVIQDKKIDYLENILSLDDEKFKLFFSNMSFKLGLDNIIEKIKKVLKEEKYLSSDFKTDRTFQSLIGLLKEDFYNKVKEKESVQYTMEEFSNMSQAIFNNMRSEKLSFISPKKEDKKEDKSILEKTFSRQLKDIGIEDDDIYDYNDKRILTEINLKELHQSSEITKQDIDDLDNNTIETWKLRHRRKYRQKENNEDKAYDLFYELLEKDLDLSGQKIPIKAISIGQFIKLSDIPQIGWNYTWKEEYKNND